MSDSKTPSPRQRVTRPDTAAEEPKTEAKGDETASTGGEPGQPVAEAPAAEETKEETSAKARGRGPYRASGTNVIDRDGRSVCVVLDGDLDIRESTAAWITEKLNA